MAARMLPRKILHLLPLLVCPPVDCPLAQVWPFICSLLNDSGRWTIGDGEKVDIEFGFTHVISQTSQGLRICPIWQRKALLKDWL